LGRSRPKKLISPSGPGPAQKAGLGQDPPGPTTKTVRGNYFPPTPACRTLFVLHAEKKKNKYKNEGEEELPGAGEAMTCCVSGGAVVPTTAPSVNTVSHVLPGSLLFFRFLTFPRGF